MLCRSPIHIFAVAMAALVLLASASSAWGLSLLHASTRLGGGGGQPHWQPPAGAGQDKVLRLRLRSMLNQTSIGDRTILTGTFDE